VSWGLRFHRIAYAIGRESRAVFFLLVYPPCLRKVEVLAAPGCGQ
jgi:hypothetical protein